MKKRIVIFKILLFACISVMPADAQRVRLCFDEGWQFHLGDIALKQAVKAGQQGGLTDTGVPRIEGEETKIAYTDRNKTIPYNPADWSDVSIPHDWLLDIAPEEDYTIGSQGAGNGFHRPGIGCYRKEFTLDESCRGKVISLEFDGIFRCSTVWVNGHLMGHHESGYIPSFYNISEVARYGDEGENVVFVKVDAKDYEGWWYEGCGIYRHTWLTITDELHVARFGTYVTTPLITSESADVNMETTVENFSPFKRSFRLVNTVKSTDGTVLEQMETTCEANGGETVVINQSTKIENPVLWSPETPYLYKMYTEIIGPDGQPVDHQVTTFGVRSVEMRGDGFYLNGKIYPIKGTANHQDHAGVGVALPDKLQSYRIRLLKEMGSNGYRSAHHPPTPELLDVCDSLGMLVMDENRHLWVSEDGMNDLRTLILRDRNHPCVFMWCLENEENLEGTPMGARLLAKLDDVVHRLDPSRQTTAAINHGWNEGGYSRQVDVVGYNYGQRGMQYVKDHEQYPDRIMFATESTSYVSTRGEYKDDWVKGHISNFGMGISWGLQPGEDWQHVVDYPWLGGTFVWTGFDYRGEPTPFGWPCVSSHFGIMDVCGFPKDGYYAYKAAWQSEPRVHVFPHWNMDDMKGETVRMGVYTNCERVELIVNGKSQGVKSGKPSERLEWNVVYQPGRVEVRGYNGKKMVAREIQETAGPARQIVIEPDVRSIVADGKDLVVMNLTLLDEKGRFVPNANHLIDFEVKGPGRIIGTGNGDPSCHDPERVPWRKTFNGHCQVIIQSTGEAGDIQLVAKSEGLKTQSSPVVKALQRYTVYVSPYGDDRNNGTHQMPFRTIQAAKKWCQGISAGKVTIVLADGTHYLDSTLVITHDDSNDRKHLCIRAENPQKAIISGGKQIFCIWEKAHSGIYRTNTGHLAFKPEMLTVDGNLRILARYPDYRPDGRRFGGTDSDATSAERIAGWQHPEKAYVHAMHPADWGDFHYRIKGTDDDGTPVLEGGWQNNRPAEPSVEHRMVENVIEELDAPGEWFYDDEDGWLYYKPLPDEDIESARIEVSNIAGLISIVGTESETVSNVSLEGLCFTMTERTFMQSYEPLLRSDWAIYRGGAVYMENTSLCGLKDCDMYNLGGNAIFISGRNDRSFVKETHIHDIGASGICVVGRPSAVRSPSFNYYEYVDINELDFTPGPVTDEYPKDCQLEGNLIHHIGLYEKQVAGIELSMSMGISVSHNTIYHTPRAALNIGDGTWGGHTIVHNDMFDTVRETGDHGTINAWGRDRFWHPDRSVMDSIVRCCPKLPLADAMYTIVIDHNRIRCDKGWDIDLDDGASNYRITRNLCLQGGIKLREGFYRTVDNNILVNNTFHPHVWFNDSKDVFIRNIVMRPYEPVNISDWGKKVDDNVFTDSLSLQISQEKWGQDIHSCHVPVRFSDPLEGDYTVINGIVELQKVGFEQFPMEDFGVQSARLRQLAAQPQFSMPVMVSAAAGEDDYVEWQGLRIQNVNNDDLLSATGMFAQTGIYVMAVINQYSRLNGIIRTGDVILSVNGKDIGCVTELPAEIDVVSLKIFRNQKMEYIKL